MRHGNLHELLRAFLTALSNFLVGFCDAHCLVIVPIILDIPYLNSPGRHHALCCRPRTYRTPPKSHAFRVPLSAAAGSPHPQYSTPSGTSSAGNQSAVPRNSESILFLIGFPE